MTAVSTQLLLAIVGALATVGAGGGIYSAATVGATRRKLLAEADGATASTVALLGKSAVDLLDPLRQRIKELEGEVDQLRGTVRQLNAEIADRDATIVELRSGRGRRRPPPTVLGG